MSESREVKALRDKWYSMGKKERRAHDYSFRRFVHAQSGGLLKQEAVGYKKRIVRFVPVQVESKPDAEYHLVHSECSDLGIDSQEESTQDIEANDIPMPFDLRQERLVEVEDIAEEIEPIQQVEWNPIQKKAIERRERSERMRLELIARRGKTEYKKTPEQYLQSLRSRAEKKGIDFDLTPDWIEAKMAYEFCEATGIRFRGKGNDPFGRTIDRKDSSKGYTKANCWVACWMYNRAKMDNTHEDVIEMVNAMSSMSLKVA